MGFSPTVSSGTVSKQDRHYGYNITNGLSAYRNALASVGSNLVRIIAVGDSITYGYFASSQLTTSWSGVLRTALQGRFGGNTGTGPTNGSYTGTWTATPSSQPATGYGYLMGYHTSTDTTGASYASSGTIAVGNIVDVFYGTNTDGGTATVEVVNSGSTVLSTLGTINCSGSSLAMNQVVTYTIPSVTNPQNVRVVPASGNVYMQGFSIRTASTGIELFKSGVSGSTAANWDNATDKQGWNTFNHNLAIIALGTNDFHSQTLTSSNIASTISSYQTAMGNIITTFQNQGASVMLVPMHRYSENWNFSNADYFMTTAVKTMYGLADTYNCALVDVYQAFNQSYEFAQMINLIGSGVGGDAGFDPVHPSDTGHMAIARIVEPHLV